MDTDTEDPITDESRSRQPADRGSGSDDPQIIQLYSHGRVVQMPSLRSRSKDLRDRLLRHIAYRAFELGRDYTEQEVNQALMGVFDDYVALRRYLVESKYLMRDQAGRQYRLPALALAPAVTPAPAVASTRGPAQGPTQTDQGDQADQADPA